MSALMLALARPVQLAIRHSPREWLVSNSCAFGKEQIYSYGAGADIGHTVEIYFYLSI